MQLKNRFILWATISAVLLMATACAPAAPPVASATIPEITIHAVDFAYKGPAQIPSGLVKLTMVNDGKEPHQAQLARLNDGVTMEQLMGALQGPPEAALGMVSLAGGPNAVNPGLSQTVTLNLAPGNYVALCFVSGADQVPHLAKGMVASLQVAPAPSGAAAAPNPVAAEPSASASLTLKDYAFELPANVKAGPQVWKITNNGPEPHEFTLLRVKEGKTIEDVLNAMQSGQGEPPIDSAGGLAAVAAGTTAWVDLDLKPGAYIAICFVPDASGKPHFQHGMMSPFTVQ